MGAAGPRRSHRGYSWHWSLLVGLGCALAFLSSQPARAATYECLDASGLPIFTDSPSQLMHCSAAAVSAPGLPVPPAPTPAVPNGAPSVTSAPSAGPSPVIVPLQRAGRSLVVRARLNGSREARLILDTGADLTILSRSIAQDLGLLPADAERMVSLQTVGGPVQAAVIRVEAIGLGEAEARQIAAAVHDLPNAPAGVEGLLGLTFLDRFVVTLDAQRGELRLERKE